jgi:hypothetical protein
MKRDPTTLELARMIADAVLKTRKKRRVRDSSRDPATNAVLDTLFKTHTWFLKGDPDSHGVIKSESERALRPS